MKCIKNCSNCPGRNMNIITGDYQCRVYSKKNKEDKILKFYLRILKINVTKLEEKIEKRSLADDRDSFEFDNDSIIDISKYIDRQAVRIFKYLSKNK